MAAADSGYSKRTAQKAIGLIRKTQSGKRCAYAVGRWATTAPVVTVVRGSAMKAKSLLMKTHYAKGSEPKNAVLSKRVEPVNWGLLKLEGGDKGRVLVLECARKPTPVLAAHFRNFFVKQMKVNTPWNRVIFRNITGD